MAWYTVPCRPIDNGIVPAIINLPLVVDLAEVDRVGEQLVDLAARKWSAPNLPVGRKYAARRMDLILAHLSGDQPNIPQFEVSREDLSYERCMVLDDLEAATVGLVSSRLSRSIVCPFLFSPVSAARVVCGNQPVIVVLAVRECTKLVPEVVEPERLSWQQKSS